jgi:2-oxoglutarate dehydrogenase complex dehydrogenase (E1) component-like enzyme
MYKTIKSLKTVPQKYEAKLIEEGLMDKKKVDEFRNAYFAELDQHLIDSVSHKPKVFKWLICEVGWISR